MAAQPFKNEPEMKIKNLREAGKLLKRAEVLMKRGAKDSGDWAEYDTFIHFADEIGKVLSDDNGEAGMTPWAKDEYNICI